MYVCPLLFRSCYSPMTTSIGSMTSSCLQQRSDYPAYMFHDPLALSAQYAAHPRPTPCNPSVGLQQPTQHASYASGPTGASSTGKIPSNEREHILPHRYTKCNPYLQFLSHIKVWYRLESRCPFRFPRKARTLVLPIIGRGSSDPRLRFSAAPPEQ